VLTGTFEASYCEKRNDAGDAEQQDANNNHNHLTIMQQLFIDVAQKSKRLAMKAHF
jgi:hypothetical protein